MDLNHYFPVFVLPMVIAVLLLLRHYDKKKQHRSFMQLCIQVCYGFLRFTYAVARAMDVGYLEYRRVMREEPPVIENELHLGKAIG